MAQLTLNNSVLVLVDESGSSAVDLSTIKGDDGIRGPQGPAGIVLTPTGTIDMTGYATETWVTEQIEAMEDKDVDLSDYYTKAETSALVRVNLENYYTKTEVDELTEVDLSNYYTKAETLQQINSGLAYYENNTENLIAAALTNYYTIAEVNAMIPDVSKFVTEDYVTTAINNAIAGLDGSEVAY